MLQQYAELITAIAAVIAAGAAVVGLSKIREVHISINSRMDQLLKATGLAAHADGVEQGRSDTQKDKA